MKREWKPGDVTLVEAGCWANRKVALRLAEGWSHENGVNVDGDGVVSVVRPLVVIDPEDREQVERLVAAVVHAQDYTPYDADDSDAQIVAVVQAALREFANPKPPKPDEPQGLGAVVEDADGKRWTRIDGAEIQPWVSGGSFPQRWKDIDAVRILSEGVTQ